VICYFLGGPTFPQSVRVASATVAPGGTYLSFPRRSISSEEPLSLIPFVPGKNSDEKQQFCIWTLFSSIHSLRKHKTTGGNVGQHQIFGLDPLFLSPFVRVRVEILLAPPR
jgi:hypothetical protein